MAIPTHSGVTLQTRIYRGDRYSPPVGAGLGITPVFIAPAFSTPEFNAPGFIAPGFTTPGFIAPGLMDDGFTAKFLGSAPGGSVTTIVPSADSTAVAIDTTVLGIVPGTVTLMVDSVVDAELTTLLLLSPAESVAIVTDPVDFESASVCEEEGAPRVIWLAGGGTVIWLAGSGAVIWLAGSGAVMSLGPWGPCTRTGPVGGSVAPFCTTMLSGAPCCVV